MRNRLQIQTGSDTTSRFFIQKIEVGIYWAVDLKDESSLPLFRIKREGQGWVCHDKNGGLAASGKTIKAALQSAVNSIPFTESKNNLS